MAKTARTTTRRTAAREEFTPTTLTLPRLKDTANFAKFGIEVERGTTHIPFGTVYIPITAAVGVTSLTVTLIRGGR